MLSTVILALFTGANCILKLDLDERVIEDASLNYYARRSTVATSVDNRVTSYTANLKVGENETLIRVVVDTGSSDLWFMSPNNPYCQGQKASISLNNQIDCSSITPFDCMNSKTCLYRRGLPYFHNVYGDTSFAKGQYFSDTVSLEDTKFNCTFAFARESNTTDVILGIGLPALESSVGFFDGDTGEFSPTYANFPFALKEQGIINRAIYSIWLNTARSSSGFLIFGGYSNHFATEPLRIPMISDGSFSVPSSISVMLSSIDVYAADSSAPYVPTQTSKYLEFARPALLDTGTTYSLFPKDIFDALIDQAQAIQNSDGEYEINCAATGGFIFNLGGVRIPVPYSAVSRINGDTCTLTFRPTNKRMILGATLLRSVYMIVDLESKEVALAEPGNSVVRVSTGDHMTEFDSNGIQTFSESPDYSQTSTNTDFTAHELAFTQAPAPSYESNYNSADQSQQTGSSDMNGSNDSAASGDANTASSSPNASSPDNSGIRAKNSSILFLASLIYALV